MVLAALAEVLFGDVGAEVHGGRVVPEEERLIRFGLLLHPVERAAVTSSSMVSMRFLVSGPVSRPSARLCRRPCSGDAAGPEPLLELGVLRDVGVPGFLLGIQAVEIAEVLVEAVKGREEFVLVAEMVLAELSRDIAERLQHSAIVGSSFCKPTAAPGMPTLVRPVRMGIWPVMKHARPAVQLCCA